MKDSPKIKEVCDLFLDTFGHLDIEYPVPVEDITGHNLFTEDQISILVSEGFLCNSEPDPSLPK
jgi:hypothetical protein